MAVGIRGIVTAVVMFLCLLFGIVALVTPLGTAKQHFVTPFFNFSATAEIGVFKTCFWTTGMPPPPMGPGDTRYCNDTVKEPCSAAKNKVLTIRAFYILSIMASVGGIVVGALNGVGPVPVTSTVTAIVCCVHALLDLMVAAIALSIFTRKECAGPPVPPGTVEEELVGPSIPLMFVCCFLCIVAIVLNLVLPKGPKDGEPEPADAGDQPQQMEVKTAGDAYEEKNVE